ncbi:MAG: c-type cytochrome [Pseudomonadota bacterium]
MKRSLLAAAGLALLAAATGGHAAGNAEAGKQKSAMCAGCHGIPGYRTAYPEVYPVPKLGGQHPEYLVAALEAYKSGARKHPSMTAIAGSLSAQDMADLAAYYGGQGSGK